MASQVEHANLSVRDVDATLRFLLTALPDWRVRHDARPVGGSWLHVGNDETYLALNQMEDEGTGSFAHSRPGFNHVGFVVDDAPALLARMLAAGYRQGYEAAPHPYRTRVYLLDDDGIEWEFVSYSSDLPAERNDYELG